MNKRFFPIAILLLMLSQTTLGCNTIMQASSTHNTQGDPGPSQISAALKEMLTKGLTFAVDKLGQKDGFWGDAAMKILFPKEAQFAADKLRQVGLGNLVDDFEMSMNRGAEDAVKQALPIFVDALTSMSFSDVKNVLLGNETAATEFFKAKTGDALYRAFSPRIKASMDKTGAASAWTKVTSTYNAMPFVQNKVETDIVRYATNRAMDGLFKKVAEQEIQMRQNPVFRTTKTLVDVFGYADRVKAAGTGNSTKGGKTGKGGTISGKSGKK